MLPAQIRLSVAGRGKVNHLNRSEFTCNQINRAALFDRALRAPCFGDFHTIDPEKHAVVGCGSKCVSAGQRHFQFARPAYSEVVRIDYVRLG